MDRDHHVRVMLGRVLIQALVWTVSVEMGLGLTQHGLGVLLVVDEYPVGALGSDAADKPLGNGVRPRRARWGFDHVDAFAGNHASKDPVNVASRSEMRNRNNAPRPSRSITRLRACWVVQAAVGLAVTARMWMRPVAISMTNSTDNRRNATVSI